MDDRHPNLPEPEHGFSQRTLKGIHAVLPILVGLTAWNFVL
jgi:hypothetical protein